MQIEDFYQIIQHYDDFDISGFIDNTRPDDVARVLSKSAIDESDFLKLLSPAAENYLEEIAQKAQQLTWQNFGKVIVLYAPLYLSNFCDNDCLYCGFQKNNQIIRKKLSLQEVNEEARAISESGIRHILVLTGGSRQLSPLEYILECLEVLKKYFSSISIEIYPLETDEYRRFFKLGVDGVTVYQETYDRQLYSKLHSKGPKSDYLYRLDTPERAAKAGMRSISIGALLGLGKFYNDVFFTGMHARYLQDKYLEAELSVSLPRIKPQVGDFKPLFNVMDKDFVRAMLALRIFLPRVGINISTREGAGLRSNLIGLGVTRMSAGSKTEVGGYSSGNHSEGQFEIEDKSSVEDIKHMILEKGHQPVFKDWQML